MTRPYAGKAAKASEAPNGDGRVVGWFRHRWLVHGSAIKMAPGSYQDPTTIDAPRSFVSREAARSEARIRRGYVTDLGEPCDFRDRDGKPAFAWRAEEDR